MIIESFHLNKMKVDTLNQLIELSREIYSMWNSLDRDGCNPYSNLMSMIDDIIESILGDVEYLHLFHTKDRIKVYSTLCTLDDGVYEKIEKVSVEDFMKRDWPFLHKVTFIN